MTLPTLQLIESFTKPKAKLDALFIMKREIIRVASRLADYKINNPDWIFLMQKHPTNIYVCNYINTTYYDFLETRLFDQRLCKLLQNESIGGQNGYLWLEFTPKILKAINRSKSRPKYLSPPLVYDGRNIVSLYTLPFYGQVITDCFEHPTITIRNGYGDKYFSHLNKITRPYPTFTQHFAIAQGIDIPFQQFNTTFEITYLQLKGLFNMWYGMTF